MEVMEDLNGHIGYVVADGRDFPTEAYHHTSEHIYLAKKDHAIGYVERMSEEYSRFIVIPVHKHRV